MCSGSFKEVIYTMGIELIYLIRMYRKGLALNNQWLLICHKTRPNQIIYVIYLMNVCGKMVDFRESDKMISK